MKFRCPKNTKKKDICKDLFFIHNKMILIELEQWDKKDDIQYVQ